MTEKVDYEVYNSFYRESLIKKKTQGMKDVKLYFDILKHIEFDPEKDKPLLVKIRSTHKRIGDYFTNIIPKVTSDSSPEEIVKKIRALN